MAVIQYLSTSHREAVGKRIGVGRIGVGRIGGVHSVQVFTFTDACLPQVVLYVACFQPN